MSIQVCVCGFPASGPYAQNNGWMVGSSFVSSLEPPLNTWGKQIINCTVRDRQLKKMKTAVNIEQLFIYWIFLFCTTILNCCPHMDFTSCIPISCVRHREEEVKLLFSDPHVGLPLRPWELHQPGATVMLESLPRPHPCSVPASSSRLIP